jgi:predicted DNA-binding transcriptional regulator YafY
MRPLSARAKQKRLGRPTGSFTQHRRLSKLKSALEAHPGGLVLDDLAAMLHVTTRSVRRYLLELGRITELESVATEPGGAHLWRIKPQERGRSVHLRRTQAYALLAARGAFEPMRGSALFDELDLVHRQILQIAQRPIARTAGKGEIPSDQRLEDRFVYLPHPPRAPAKRGEEVDALFLAVAELYPLFFRYAGRAVEAHPYAMVLHRGALVLVALELASGDLARFAFERMSDIVPDEKRHFELPPDFDLRAWLQGAFGVARPGPRTRVVVEFDPRVAHEVRQTRLHASQKIATAPDGRVRLSIALPDLEELRRWVLGFGDAARVIEPEDLAADLARTLRQAAERYAR